MATTDFIAAIELSSSKLSGIAGRKNNDGSLQVLAYASEDASTFVHKGVIYNIDKTALALDCVIKQLESQLGKSIGKVYAGISGQSLRTVSNSVSHTLDEESVISQELVDNLCDENRNAHLADMSVLDVAPQEYRIDNALHADPVGVTGRNIIGQYLNIVARTVLKKNMELSFEQAGLKAADDFIVSPLALANAVLTDSEKRSGCALIDFGADTTTVMVFKNNLLRFLCVLPLGGNNITRDITTLKMEEEEAESLKLKYGNALYEEEENDKENHCTTLDGRNIELAQLNEIIGARTEEILLNVWELVKYSGYETSLLSGIIFTGGGANLKNLEKAFRSLTKIEKVKTVKTTCLPIEDEKQLLEHNGRQNTLIGLLNWGRENCCKLEPVMEKNAEPTLPGLFVDEEPKSVSPEPPKPKPAPTPEPLKPAPKPEPKPSKPTWWKKAIERVQQGATLFDDEKMD